MDKVLNLLRSVKKRQLIVVWLLIVISVIRIFLHIKIPYSIHPVQFTDDGLMQKIALFLSRGQYLGVYDELTLCKNYTYSYLLALCFKSFLSYPFLLSLLNIGSAFAICQSLKRYIPFGYRAIIYVLIIFSPVTFSDMTALRIYRNSILQYMTLFVFSGFIALFLRKDKNGIKVVMPWIILEGISMPLFWFVKEDSIWILPFCAAISVIALVWVWFNNKKDFLNKLIVFVIPFITTVVMGLGISSANYINYGIFTTNDRSHTEAAKLYSNLLSIEDNIEDESVWVSANVYEKASEASPTFAKVWKGLQESFGEDAVTQGDLFIWRIRTIISSLGYYTDANETNEFYRRINSELELAFEKGTLERDDLIHLSKLMKGMSFEDITKTIPKAIKNLYYISTYKDLKLEELVSTGPPDIVLNYKLLLGCDTFLNGSEDCEMNITSVGSDIVELMKKVLLVYQKTGIIIDAFSVIGFLLFVISLIRDVIKKEYIKINMFIVMSGIILSALLASFEIEAFSDYFYTMGDTFYDDFIGFYNVSIYPLVDIFKYLSIVLGTKEVIRFVDKHKSQKI